MYTKAIATLAVALLSTAAHAEPLVRCASLEPPADLQRHVSLSAEEERIAAASPAVKTYVHVVTTAAKKGKYSQSQVQEQIDVMNDKYSGMSISFTLAGTDYTVNDDWAYGSDDLDTQYDMKAALRKGNYADLNLYLLSDLQSTSGGTLFGICPFPSTAGSKKGSEDFIQDGCTINAESIPGGSYTDYNLGYTAVHEIGHWFGLFHVFQGSACSGSGDQVDDTPLQKTATSGCPKSQDSCPNSAGVDSIHNYMDYSNDPCMTSFTSGQKTRALNFYSSYRQGK